MPPFVTAAFEDMDRSNRLHAPTTKLLRTLHKLLDARVPQRTALLSEQLRSPDPGVRLDAIRMSGELMGRWRGDHSGLVTLVAGQLDAANLEVAAEAATVLGNHYAIAEPAREALATQVAAQLAEHGLDVWATPRPRLRRAHQKAVLALARLGDTPAVSSLLVALDSDVDAWLAIQVAESLPQAADQLVPRLCDHLRRVDLADEWCEMHAHENLQALAKLGDPAALAAITETLTAAVRHERWSPVCSALEALGTLGPAAAPALDAIRSLTTVDEGWVRPTAVAALWAVNGDREEVMPLLLDLLDGFAASAAADVLGEIGPPAAAALPRLRELLTHEYEWIRVHCAAALWEIGGDPEAPAVLDTLLEAWTKNPATGNHVVAYLKRMGAAAKPSLPQIRAQLARPERGGLYLGVSRSWVR